MSLNNSVNVALIGAGRIGSFHAESVVYRLADANLAAIADPAPGTANQLAEKLGCSFATTDPKTVLSDPDIHAVIIATPARYHSNLVAAAAEAGKAVFCEKPMALTIEEANRAIDAAKSANVPLQVGFNRRWDKAFSEGHEAIANGQVGTPQLLRSLTRDPGPFGADPARIPNWTIFYETLIHDFDTLLWLNIGAKPVEVYAVADALIRPDFKEAGHLDTAVVTIRFDNGAIAVADANFSALYGYDVRGEVFGSEGMVTMGDARRSSMTLFNSQGVSCDTFRLDAHHFLDAYTAQLASFINTVRTGEVKGPGGEDARSALKIALACIQSVKIKAPVSLG
ncbi:Gfo/Idh/MocA family oxidoreductase [Halomonas binhaiensis]|uniref:Gfo/Idh/MocA family oxidoreductase n=1 Tax=Halomonas binhaiensis TaxID=2562282 RepID=A0A5C1NDM2_9GAMM|nr:Gfo/Idh/MocA family oxidoreductase [Halomonas binhaiensis]QEM80980.1 Gfo/Idh/MocA family oxidoreductase [Halomonas binhaiensis]